MAIAVLVGCAGAADAPPAGPDPCVVSRAEAGGPLSAEVAAAADGVPLAMVRIAEARRSGDPGFYVLADQALGCALARDPTDTEARRWKGHVLVQFHRFADAEAWLEPLVAETDHPRDWMLLSDARMEQGDVEGAGDALDRALQEHPSLETWDRAAHLAWLSGDLDGAVVLQERAVDAGQPSDPEPLAWALVRLGELKAMRGEVPNELGLALRLLPDYPPAHLALGRWFLAASDTERARDHLGQAGRTVAAWRALAEIDRDVDVREVAEQDPRGFAIWLAERDPERALALLDAELEARRDATTQMARAWALHHAGLDGRAEARAALSTGIADPVVWLQGAVVLGDGALASKALQTGVLSPSERRAAERVIAVGA